MHVTSCHQEPKWGKNKSYTLANTEKVTGLYHSGCALTRTTCYLHLFLVTLCTAQPLSQAKGKEETDLISLAGSEAFLCLSQAKFGTPQPTVRRNTASPTGPNWFWSNTSYWKEPSPKKIRACIPCGGTGGAKAPAPHVASQAHHKHQFTAPGGCGLLSSNTWCQLKHYLALKHHTLSHIILHGHIGTVQNTAKVGTKCTLGSRDNSKRAFVSMWDSSP